MIERTISFYPEVAKQLGSIPAALFYQQLCYWSNKGTRKDGFIFKTKDDLEEETTLSREQQDKARKLLEKIGWLEVKKIKAKGSPTLHYKCLVDIKLSISGKHTIGNVGNTPLETCVSHDSYIQEITTENTTERTALAADAAQSLEMAAKTPDPVNQLIQVFYEGGNKNPKLFSNKTERASAEWLIKHLGFASAVTLAQKALSLIGNAYAPQAYTPVKLQEKYLVVQKYSAEKPKKNGFSIVSI